MNQFFTSKPPENDKYYITEDINEKKLGLSLSKKNRKNNDYPKKNSDFLNFHKKNYILSPKTTRDNLEYRTIQNYSHMKTILGHVKLDENLSISPIPIFCMCFSEDGEFIYTGDDNGTIKIWSTLTGAIVETFRLFSPNDEDSAINDLLAFNNCLIACSEDRQVIIWNKQTMRIEESFSFDEALSNVNGYIYEYEGIKRYLLIIGAQSGKIYFVDMNMKNSKDEAYKQIFPIKFHIDKSIQDNYSLGRTKSLELTGMSSDDYNGLLVSGFQDGLVCIWDTLRILDVAIKKKEFLHNFTQYVFYAQLCHRTTVQLIEFSPDKTHFLTGSLDGTVLVWRIIPEIIASIRQDFSINRNLNFNDRIPVSTLNTISESEDRIKCTVNVATWTKKNNYIIAMISSKPRKKPRNECNNYNELDFIEEDINSKKRTSSLIVYSLKLNKIIHKYNDKSGIKGLNFIDENYIFGCHPLYEEIIFTLNGTRNIILFNIKTGEILKIFKQNDFFFELDKRTPLACEGMFSKKGDYFAITTYSGSLSIFSIYSKNSYSATYMNQFYSNEFDPNLEQISNNFIKTGIPSLTTIFPRHVNMYNLPYIIEQPYSIYKLEQIKNSKRIINDKYCISNRELKHRFLANNLVIYRKNLSERILEAQKEEEAYYNAEKDNMNYRINRNNNENNDENIDNNNFEDDRLRDEDYNENREDNESNSSDNNRRDRNNYSYNVENDSDISDESNMELSPDDLRVTNALRNRNYNNNNYNRNDNSNSIWSQRLRRPIYNENNNNIIQQRVSTRYNLRNNTRNNNNSSHSNSLTRNIANNSGRNYNLRNLRNRTEINNENSNNNIIVNNENENNNVTMNVTHYKKKNIIEDDEDDEDMVKNKDNNKSQDKNKDNYEYAEEDDIIIINKQKKEDKEEKKKEEKEIKEEKEEKEQKEKTNAKKHIIDDDEDYIEKKSPKKVKRKVKKKGRKKKHHKNSEDDEEYDYNEDSEYSEYDDSESEDNKEALKGLEAEELEDELEEREMKEDPDYEGIDGDDETFTLVSKHKKHKKLVRRNRIESEISEESIKEKEINQEFKKDPEFTKNKYHKLLMDKITNDHIQHPCYFCRQIFEGNKEDKNSVKIFGPFYYNENTGKVSPVKLNNNPNNTSEKEIYIDFNCFAQNNDFVYTTKKYNIFNPTTSIEEVIKQRKICFRCGSPFATKKCHSCQKMFHGNLCLSQMTEEYNGNKFCLECYKKKINKIVQEKIKQKKIYFEKLDKKYFLGDKIYNSQYYPQKGEEVYFILHAYIQFLRDKYMHIIYEIDEKKQRLFWWAENTYIEKNQRFSFYEPFLCKVKNIEYVFPNYQTIALIKDKSDANQFYSNLKVLIKLQLDIIDLKDTEITIILVENDNPDFLVRKAIYEETQKYYDENIVTQNQNNINLEVNLGEDIIKVCLAENKPEEDNENFGKSKYNSLKVITEKDKDEQKYSFWDICINGNNNDIITDKMKYLMSGLKETIQSVYDKNSKEVDVFWEMVSEENVFNYYNEIPIPMFLKLIINRLENNYYITEESLKFDIQILVDNAKRFNSEFAEISKDAEILKNRLFARLEQLNNKYGDKKQVISNGTNIKINLNSDSGGESIKKMTGKKRKRILADLDIDENIIKDYDESEDYLFGNFKKRETRSSNHHYNNNINNYNGNNNYNDISINIQINKENNYSIEKARKKKKIY